MKLFFSFSSLSLFKFSSLYILFSLSILYLLSLIVFVIDLSSLFSSSLFSSSLFSSLSCVSIFIFSSFVKIEGISLKSSKLFLSNFSGFKLFLISSIFSFKLFPFLLLISISFILSSFSFSLFLLILLLLRLFCKLLLLIDFLIELFKLLFFDNSDKLLLIFNPGFILQISCKLLELLLEEVFIFFSS